MRSTASACANTLRLPPTLRLRSASVFILKEERTFPQSVPDSYLRAPAGYIEAAGNPPTPYEPKLASVAAVIADASRARMLSYPMAGDYSSAGGTATTD